MRIKTCDYPIRILPGSLEIEGRTSDVAALLLRSVNRAFSCEVDRMLPGEYVECSELFGAITLATISALADRGDVAALRALSETIAKSIEEVQE